MAETFVATHAPDNGRASYNGLQADEWGAIGAAAIFLGLACYHGTMCAVRRSYLLWTLPLSGFRKSTPRQSIKTQRTDQTQVACLSLLEFAYSLERYLHTALLILGALCRWYVRSTLLEQTNSNTGYPRSYRFLRSYWSLDAPLGTLQERMTVSQ